MKFRKFGRITLALAVSLGTGLGVTSCSTDHTVGYFYVTGVQQYNQISGYKIDNNLGNLTATPNSPYGSGGYNPTKALVTNAGKFLYVLNAGCGGTGQAACPSGADSTNTGANISLFTIGGKGSMSFQASYTSQGNQPIAIQADSSGTHLFVLDTHCSRSNDMQSVCGRESLPPSAGISPPSTSTPTPAGFRSSPTSDGEERQWHQPLRISRVGSGPINFYREFPRQLLPLHDREVAAAPGGTTHREASLCVRKQQRPADSYAEHAHPRPARYSFRISMPAPGTCTSSMRRTA